MFKYQMIVGTVATGASVRQHLRDAAGLGLLNRTAMKTPAPTSEWPAGLDT